MIPAEAVESHWLVYRDEAGPAPWMQEASLKASICITIEQEPEYLPLIQARIDRQGVA